MCLSARRPALVTVWAPRFVETPAPPHAEIKRLAENVTARTIRQLVRRGLLDEAAWRWCPWSCSAFTTAG
jgi:hypothetical protein